MGTTTKVAFRALRASALVVFVAACAQEQQPLEPDARANLPQTADVAVRVARVIEPGQLGLANPAGLAFSPRAGTLFLVTRTPGMPPGSMTDIELITLAEDRAGTVRIAAGVTDPVNMAFDGNADRLLIFESSNNQLIEIMAGPDGSLDPQTLGRIDARHWGLRNPQGLTVDPASGRLFILDATGPRIVSVEPDPQLGFERPIISEIDLARTGLSDLRGLAFDPTDGHLHVLDPAAQALHELTETGQIVATRDLSEFDFRNTQGMTFGPSGDTTDDPSEMSLYIADSGVGGGAARSAGSTFAESGHITELSFDQPVAVSASLFAAEVATLVRTIDTWRFSPPSPDPAGITYLGHKGTLLISDSEVNEMSIFRNANLFEITLGGNLLKTGNTTLFLGNNEPTGVTWNPTNNHIFISNDDQNEIYEHDSGPDKIYGTGDDNVTSFDTGAFGCGDAEGVAYGGGDLFIVDGVNREVYRVSPGSNGVFDGVGRAGDDVVTHFDTRSLGLEDPEGIAYDSDFGHLYIVGKPATLVFHVTTTGQLLRTIDISAANPDKPAGLAYGPGSSNPAQMSLYVVDRGVDNNSDSRENDGKMYEFSLPSSSGNALPTVTITAPANGSTYDEGDPITFTGTATDAEDGSLTADLSWTSSRDGTIGSGGSFSTSSLSLGTHTITASVEDSGGLQGSSAITVTVNIEGLNTLDVRVAASTDDAEEDPSGGIDLTSSDLELVFDSDEQTVGMRFNAVAIPPGATIYSAYIQFQVDEDNSEPTSLTLQGAATDNAVTFSSSSWNISSRNRTASSVSWSPVPWTTVGEAGADQRTPDISSVIQEIVNRPGWSSGNSLAIIITGTGHRTAESYDGVAGAAPLLHVGYLLEVNHPPVAVDDEGSVAEGGTLNVATPGVLGNDSDPDGDQLTVTTTPVSGPSHGSLTLNDDGSYTYAHDGGPHTSDSFVYQVCDAEPLCATATVNLTITGPNDPPVAADDEGSVAEGGTLNVPAPGVLGNDSDPDGDALTVTTTPVSGPSNGTLTLNADGSYTYEHNGTATTSDAFVYQVCDTEPLCATATVTITITEANNPPTATDDIGSVAEGGMLNVAAPGVLDNDGDPDNDQLTVTTTPVMPPVYGSLTLNANGSYTYTHNGSETTSDSFVYQVCDTGALCATATVRLTITPVNDPPVAFNDVGTVAEGGTLSVAAPGVLSNDSDPEGDLLTVTRTVTPPAYGSLTLNADGSYTYTHNGDPSTNDSFVYEVCDTGSLCTTATVNLTVTGGVYVVTPAGSDGYSTSGGKNSDRHLEVTVTLVDRTGAPVAGASVTATITGPTVGGGTATTDALGKVTFRITNAPSGTYTTVVTDVTGAGLTWDGATPPNSFSK